MTDAFGDFKFDGLEENSSWYRVEIAMKGFAPHALPLARLDKSVSLGVIRLG